MNDHAPLRTAALLYAGFGWCIIPLHGITESPDGTRACTCHKGAACPVPGKHPRVRMGRGYAGASSDPAVIASWWKRAPNSNVGIATGHAPGQSGPNLCVLDVDGQSGVDTLASLCSAAGLTAIPRTLQASSGRPEGGIHLYYLSEICPQSSGNGLDSRGDGGLVVAPPSRHVSGATYAWTYIPANDAPPIATLPPALATTLAGRTRAPRNQRALKVPRSSVDLSTIPAHLRTRTSPAVGKALKKAAQRPATLPDIQAALAVIPNPDLGWDAWNRVLMTAYACDQSPACLDSCISWSRKSAKYAEGACEERWQAYAGSPPRDLNFGTLCFLAREADPAWQPPSQRAVLVTPAPPRVNGHNGHDHLPSQLTQGTPDNPLIDLNNKYSVIGDVGGKCLVLGRVPSKVDPSILIPSFQSFTSFSERYSNKYIMTGQDEEPKQLGKHWLKWAGRTTYDGIDLMPNQAPVLPGNVLNLWSGFACPPAKGCWSALRDHIACVLAAGQREHLEYIVKYAAWAVQNPGERAEVALVFRGGKGSGKGTFANALKRLFGQHGLQIFNSKHLTGSFNGHLRNCLLLFADEAFWAGDRPGESVLKGMLTEPALIIEQKGVDAVPWRNRLHVIMAANADWVVPASHDERRYAMFDVSDHQISNRRYFDTIHAELVNGGLAAMLYDLLSVSLGDWHPRQVIHTAALQQQKARSLDPKHEWMEQLLQSGEIPIIQTPTTEYVCSAAVLLSLVREAGGRHAHNITANALGRFLHAWGCIHIHRAQGSAWRFLPLDKLRSKWEEKYGSWDWDIDLRKWNERGTV